MDGRFFGIPRSSHLPGYYYSVPVQRQRPARSPKVVSIPVQFEGSEPAKMRSRTESAGKIQAAFRGFMTRKYVRKIDAVRREVEEVERRVYEEEMSELMRRDERERLKVNEALMSLLFRLDSVRGVDAGVRELRKKVIRKAIALQEKVDAIAAAADSADWKGRGASEVEQSEKGGADSPDQEEESGDAEQIEEQVADLPDQEKGRSAAAESQKPVLDLPDQEEEEEEGGSEDEQREERVTDVLNQKQECDVAEQREDSDIDLPDQEGGGADEAKQKEDQVPDGSREGSDHDAENVKDACALFMEMEPPLCETSGESHSSLNPESFLEEVHENDPVKEDDEQAKSFEEKEVAVAAGEVDRKVNNRSEEMLGRMMEDNEKMIWMMMQLFERNERQTQLLSQLSQRVDRLEKACLCEKLRRKKKRPAAVGKRSIDSNQCGKRL